MGFAAWNHDQLRVPLRGEFGQLMAATFGQVQDEELELLRGALLCRFPSRCPDDALDALGSWYRIERYPGESHTSYRARLVAAWETWTKAGSAEAVEAQFRAAFGAALDVRCYADEELQPFGPYAWYSRFAIVLGPNLGTVVAEDCVLGAWTLGVDQLGSTIRTDQRRIAKSIVLKWKSAHGYPGAILVRRSGADVLGIDFVLGSSELGGSPETTIVWIGRLLGTAHGTTLGAWVLGGYDRS